VATKERMQNPTCGDNVRLRLLTYNSNNRRDVQSIENIEIYFLDPNEISPSNPDGRRLVQTISGENVVQEDTGQYLIEVPIVDPLYTIGKYIDAWYVTFEDGENETACITNHFIIYPDLWFTSPVPPVYDFSFAFRPNKIRKGSKRYIIIQITPNVPRGSDILHYYESLAIVSDLRVSIEIGCGECVPAEQDLRLLVDRALVDYREKMYAYYFLDTNELECGIYNIWFELAFGENVFISEKNQFQIFD
jgi:hypothetical protein